MLDVSLIKVDKAEGGGRERERRGENMEVKGLKGDETKEIRGLLFISSVLFFPVLSAFVLQHLTIIFI